MNIFLAAALLVGSANASAAPRVEVATGDWSAIPTMRHNGLPVDAFSVTKISRLVDSGECVIPNQKRGKLDLTVPFLVQFAPDGTAQRVVLQRIGCSAAEGVLAGALLELLENRAYRPTGANPDGWYRSEVSFSSS